jgi:hypothetical protein
LHIDAGAPDRSVAFSDTLDGWTVLVIACPAQPGERVPGLNPCSKDILKLLALAEEPLSAARIRKALEAQGIDIHAYITVRRALSCLLHHEMRCQGA